jgi:UDP-2-acetamido-2,6-beta-L-arabino-hexul-4-ose reductase
MRRVVVTGARGFIGRNLMVALRRRDDVEATGFDVDDSPEALRAVLPGVDVVYHLAGVNRPQDPAEFWTGNVGFTAELCSHMDAIGGRPAVVFASSTQAELDNSYGASKLAAEDVLATWSRDRGGGVAVFRLPNVFGKWGRPSYNSVVVTFCHNVAHGLSLHVDDPDAAMRLVHVDDVVTAFLHVLEAPPRGMERRTVTPVTEITVGELAARVQAFRAAQHSPDLPDLSGCFARALFSTYLSYLEPEELVFHLDVRADERGDLAELIREPHAGQVFVSRTHPGITRGNHYHDTKVERFMVIAGEGLVRLRPLGGDEVREYPVSGDAPQAVIIPPGAVHSIENVGPTEMVTLFWAGEVFDPTRPDTYYERVLREEEGS